jgi:polysaccharide export outer membrane protein
MVGKLAKAGCAVMILWLGSVGSGCLSAKKRTAATAKPILDVPRELDKFTLPPIRVEPPDILVIEAHRVVPRPPHKIEPLDVLVVQLADPLPPPAEPLLGLYPVETDGTISLGASYGGSVQVGGLTLAEAKKKIEEFLAATVKLKDPKVSVSLGQTRAAQRISGTHLVRPDGTVGLGSYGSVQVAGLTLAEVKRAVEGHLSRFLLDPEVSVEVQGFNSKKVYVIQDGGGAGQTVQQLPCTGNETVLDAIAQLNGLSPVSSTDLIWVARPAPAGSPHQILPVNWSDIVCSADTTTNYQLFPGDRVYVAAQPLVKLDTRLSRILAPVERLFGVALLGTQTVNQIRFPQQGIGGGLR